MNQRRINLITGLLLILGLGSALAIYLTADHAPTSSLLNDPLAHKRYVRSLRMIGGKANVLAADITDWFEGLWRGESLAWTIAVLTVGGTLAFRFVIGHSNRNAPSAEEKIRPPTPSTPESGR